MIRWGVFWITTISNARDLQGSTAQNRTGDLQSSKTIKLSSLTLV